ncbi:protein NRT1/ PTR FAMILY 8.1 [Trifolium repens]|jgi:peptide/histidine transporter 3/4|nr:protein NRT1/ PTR FAMILY 8.1 [Trifolium repens]
MNRKLGNRYVIPPGFVVVFDSITGLILVPFYELIIIPFIRKVIGHCRGITSLQRIGVGLFVSIFAMASAALVEKIRRELNTVQKQTTWVYFGCGLNSF